MPPIRAAGGFSDAPFRHGVPIHPAAGGSRRRAPGFRLGARDVSLDRDEAVLLSP